MNKFKVGDVVCLTKTATAGGIKNDTRYVGVPLTVMSVNTCGWFVFESKFGNDTVFDNDYSNVRTWEKTMDNLQVGDILENDDYSYDKKIVQVTGHIIVTEDFDDARHKVTTSSSLKENTWKLKTEEEVEELTVEEVSKRLGKTVKIVK